jgi:hypothetical protein
MVAPHAGAWIETPSQALAIAERMGMAIMDRYSPLDSLFFLKMTY